MSKECSMREKRRHVKVALSLSFFFLDARGVVCRDLVLFYSWTHSLLLHLPTSNIFSSTVFILFLFFFQQCAAAAVATTAINEEDRITLRPIDSINGDVALPGSKSFTNRVILLSALAQGTTLVENILHSEDTR